MNEENRDVKIAAGLERKKDPGEQLTVTSGADRSKRFRFWANWALALLTVLCAGVVVVYFFAAVMSTAACSRRQCQQIGLSWLSPDALLYGPPVVAVLTVIASFFTAQRRWGIVVPLVALALLGIDITTLAVAVAQ
jgi:hypothetical protein